jgi:hypothetical protein
MIVKIIIVKTLICLFCVLYQYLLNIKKYILIEDDVNYPLIFLLIFL